MPEGVLGVGDEGSRVGIQFRDAFGQGQQHEGDGFGTGQRQWRRLWLSLYYVRLQRIVPDEGGMQPLLLLVLEW